MSAALEEARRRAETLRSAFLRGDEGATFAALAEADDRVTVEAARALVDDPFLPGQRVRGDLADVHPGRRHEVAVERRFEADAARRDARRAGRS